MPDGPGFSPPDQNQALTIVAPYVILLTLGTALVISRFYVRVRIVRTVWIDDYTIVFALVLATTYLGVLADAIHSGLGRHTQYLSKKQVSHIKKMLYISEPTILFCCMFTRISVALLLKRLFGINKTRIMSLYSLVAIIFVSTVPVGFLDLLQCRPMQAAWDPMPNKCWGAGTVSAINRYQCVIAVSYDSILAILPIFFLWRFQAGLLTKVGISCLLGLGMFPAVIRLVAAVLYSNPSSVDFTYTSVNRLLLRLLEESIGIIAACIPTLRPLFRSKGTSNYNGPSTPSDETRRPTGPNRFHDPFSITRALRSTNEDLDGPLGERNFSAVPSEQFWVHLKGSEWSKSRNDSLSTDPEEHGIHVLPSPT